jgi:hypothetical protein
MATQAWGVRNVGWNLNGLPVPAQLLVYIVAEWQRLQHQASRFARELGHDTVWIYVREKSCRRVSACSFDAVLRARPNALGIDLTSIRLHLLVASVLAWGGLRACFKIPASAGRTRHTLATKLSGTILNSRRLGPEGASPKDGASNNRSVQGSK